ncbi:MAG: DUF2628 domain-containing protein [Rhodoblastus sp.]|uniref:DUF2628 domain-containing protein n=1 Tax=Rhodoblastus sp. TaxID=1962975 RepID=UPI003F98F92D
MAIFTVHIPAARAGEAPSVEKIVLLRDGFSVPATVLGPFWLAWNRAWIPAIGWTVLLVLIVFAGVKLGASSETLSLVNAALALALGFEGSRLVAWSLARRHYNENAVIIGETADEAEEIFFYNWRGASAVAPPPPPPPPPPSVGSSEEPRV